MLRVSGLHKTFKEQRSLPWRPANPIEVLRGVDFAVHPGEVLGLFGANGAGKTTILHAIAGLTVPDRGTVELDGKPLTWERTRERIGLCSSADRSFYYRLSMRENLRFFASLYGLSGAPQRRRVDELLGLTDLTAVADRRYAQCSTGMRQRLSLARSLLHDPPVLLLDEPTRAIDPLLAQRFRAFVRDDLARRRRKIVVLATNVLEEAWGTCDRILLLNGGRGIAVDTPGALARRAPSARYRISLQAADAVLLRRLELLGTVSTAHADPLELQIDISPDPASLQKLLFEIVQANVLATSITLDAPSPDHLFATEGLA